MAAGILALGFVGAPALRAWSPQQEDQVLLPNQSAAKAKQVLQQAIEALGGNAYLNVHDVTCVGHLGQFDHSGAVTGYEKFIDFSIPPDKDRNENLPKRNIIQVFNGSQGWELDRGGISDAPATDLADFQDDIRKDLDNILRQRIHEPGMIFRYAGPDIVDREPAEWVELVDRENRTIRIAFNSSTHLPIREEVQTRDPKTQMKSSEVDYFSNYHPIAGVQTPFQVARDRNGMMIYQVFFDKCEYNTNLSDSLFTKASLDDRWQRVKKHRYKDEKKPQKKDKDQDKDHTASIPNDAP